MLEKWFQIGALPDNMLDGYYDLKLVGLSYLIACLASFVALDFAGRLQTEKNKTAKIYWIVGGAFAMGAGIWSMHFIGMLAFIMSMTMTYSIGWTVASLVSAMLASCLALFILQKQTPSFYDMILGGILIGLGIATMHYMGMEGMKSHMQIRYMPGLFFLSLLIAWGAAVAALWLAFRANLYAGHQQFNIRLGSALIMGVAICGMHYTGMEAAVFTPIANHSMMQSADTIPPDHLALFIAGITALIISLALTASSYYKKMVMAVQNEKEFLNAMLNNLEDGIIACDEEGHITVLNQALVRAIDSSGETNHLQDLPQFFDLLSPNNEPINRDDYPFKKMLNGERIHQYECIMRFKTGESHEIVIDGQPIINSEGKKLGAVAVIHDVTELKKTEKLKNEFVSIVSHELRTPLTSIKGSLGLLVSGAIGDFSEKAEKLLHIAHNNCDRLLLLINDILDLEKIEAGKMDFKLQTIQLNTVIAEAVEANRMYAEKYDVTIHFVATEEPIYIIADPDRLIQVLNNLLSNACKFSPKQGRIDVKTTFHDDRVQVAVQDYGSGIPKAFQERMFQKFAQADSSDTRGKGGTGLGLNISKTIIEKFGGELNFTSIPGEGTTFYFSLPRASSLPENNSETIIHKNGASQRLLLCEDDVDQSNYLKALLNLANFEVDVAETVRDARRFLQSNNYKAILLDLIMPDQDGISFIKEIRSTPATEALQIIVISAIAQTGQQLLNTEVFRVADWLDKPIDFNQLLTSINRIKATIPNAVPKIIHIEDDQSVTEVIKGIIGSHADLTQAPSLHHARKLFEKDTFDLIILDLKLPDGNGCDILPLAAQLNIPVLVFSAFKVDDVYTKYVNTTLLKTNASNQTLLNSIMNLL